MIARDTFERQYRFRWVYRSSRGTIIDDTNPKFPILKWTITKDVSQEIHATDRRQKALLEVASTKAHYCSALTIEWKYTRKMVIDNRMEIYKKDGY